MIFALFLVQNLCVLGLHGFITNKFPLKRFIKIQVSAVVHFYGINKLNKFFRRFHYKVRNDTTGLT